MGMTLETLEDSFSAVSKPILASAYSFYSSFFRSIRFAHFCTAPRSTVSETSTIFSPKFPQTCARLDVRLFLSFSICIFSKSSLRRLTWIERCHLPSCLACLRRVIFLTKLWRMSPEPKMAWTSGSSPKDDELMNFLMNLQGKIQKTTAEICRISA